MRCRNRKRSAFTLIELLVVVAIIALLISILLPSLDKARRQARQVICQTNLQSQGRAAFYYAEQNRDWMVGGILSYSASGGGNEYGVYAMSVLPWLLYDGKIEHKKLWPSNGNPPRTLTTIIRSTKLLQCPDHPTPENEMDYVSSAMSMPYSKNAINDDAAGGGWAGDSYTGQYPDPDAYRDAFRIADFPTHAQPAKLIYVTEGHNSIGNGADEMRFHTFFYASQLPFGLYPRIASDQRHPGGLVSLFYDGHATALTLTSLDPGYGNSLGVRLRWFSVVLPGYE